MSSAWRLTPEKRSEEEEEEEKKEKTEVLMGARWTRDAEVKERQRIASRRGQGEEQEVELELRRG
jgi:hypothetical protein